MTALPPTTTPVQEDAVSVQTPTLKSSGTATSQPTLTPTVTETTAATVTPSPNPTSTPKPSATPTLASIKASNAAGLTEMLVVDLPIPDQLGEVILWTPDDQKVIVQTSQGFDILDGNSLLLLSSYSGLIPVQFQEDGRLLFQENTTLGLLNIDRGETEMLPLSLDSATTPFALSYDGRKFAVAPVFDAEKGWQELKIIDVISGVTTYVTYDEAFNQNYTYLRFSHLAFTTDNLFLLVDGQRGETTVTLLIDPVDSRQYCGRLETNYRLSQDGMRVLGDGGGILSTYAPGTCERVATFANFISNQINESRWLVYRAIGYDFWGGSDRVGVYYRTMLTDNAARTQEFSGVLMIWDGLNGVIEQTFEDLSPDIKDLYVSHDGSRFLTVSTDQILRLWSGEDATLLQEGAPYRGWGKPSLSPSGEKVVFNLQLQPVVYDLTTQEEIRLPMFQDVEGIKAVFMGEDRLLIQVTPFEAAAHYEIWEIASGSLLGTTEVMTECTPSETGDLIICQEESTLILEIATGATINRIGTAGLVVETTLSRDGNFLAHCVVDGYQISLWETHSGVRSGTLMGDRPDICASMLFSPDGSLLVSASGYVWSIDTGDIFSELALDWSRPGVVRAISYDNRLAIVDQSLYDLETGAALFTFPVSLGEVRFSLDGTQVIYLQGNQMHNWTIAP
ncbi:MAG: hypothetical protein JW726_02540 [Anaerolineales bacterium]|nr:hypothetical protein [Anaerolineales bacterium]